MAAPNDNRRLEVVAEWPPPVPRRAVGHRHYDGFASQLHKVCVTRSVPTSMGAATMAARKKSSDATLSWAGEDGRARLVVLACDVGRRVLRGNLATSSASCRSSKHGNRPPLLQQHAWLYRWGSMLACSGTRALALSLLERRGGHGVHGPPPLSYDVLWEGTLHYLRCTKICSCANLSFQHR